MRPFAYVRASSIPEVVALLEEHGPAAQLLAGGTDVIARMRLGRLQPDLLIDIKRVAGLTAEIARVDGVIRVGARTSMTDVIGDAHIRRYFPALVEAARVVGSVQIRNRATLVGNICNASPAADTAPVLLAHVAMVNVVGRDGSRAVPINDFFVGPGRTILARGELVASIDLPIPRVPTGTAFGRVTRRRGVDLATVNLCALVTAVGDVRIGYGAVGPRPFVVQDDRGPLASVGARVGDHAATFERVFREARPISDVRGSREYRLAMLEVMSRRALERAHERLRLTRLDG